MTSKRPAHLIITTVVILAGALVSGTLAAARGAWAEINPAVATPTRPTDPPEGEGPWVVRAEFESRQQVEALAAVVEPWEVHYDQGYLIVEAADRQVYEWMISQGFRLQIDEKLTAQYNNPPVLGAESLDGIPAYTCYRTVEETYADAATMANAHPTLATWTDIGDTWKKTQSVDTGYDLNVLRLTNQFVPGPKPKIFILSSIHAREYAPAELNTRFAEYLLENYNLDADVTWLLDYNEVHLLLQANPDGRKRAEAGLAWRKNTNNNFCSDTSLRGVDLNRNFTFQWGCCGGSSSLECHEVYRGPWPESEPEIQAIQAYVRAQFPDQREDPLSAAAPQDASGVFIDLHSYGKLVLWPWGFTSTPAPNHTALQTLGRRLAFFNHYAPDQSIALYPTDGTTDDFAYGELGLAAYTIELGTSFFQDCTSFENTIFPDNMPALLYAAKNARSPYMTPSGPEALNVRVSPASSVPGSILTLEATLDDTRTYETSGAEPTQAIAAGEFTLDAPPWVSGAVGSPVYPVDGAFDESREEITVMIPSGGLAPGRHSLYVRGRDQSGSWGPVSAAFFYIFDTESSPRIEGYLRDQENNQPVAAEVSAGTYKTQSDPESGYYRLLLSSGAYSITYAAAQYAPLTESVVISNAQTTRADRYLLPYCSLFRDDVESGTGSWGVESPWTITNEAANSPSHSWTESPGGDYGNNLNSSLTSPLIDLGGYASTKLEFQQRYEIEDGYDYGHVEVSPDGGATWSSAATFTGLGGDSWVLESLALPELGGSPNARLRFRFSSDENISLDGWHIDDIELLGAGLNCIQPLSPTAGFTATTPIELGDPMQFTDLTVGTPPFTYTWDFGDGLGFSAEAFPQYTYATTGTFTVTLGISNTLGDDQIQVPVQVIQKVPPKLVYLGTIFTGPVSPAAQSTDPR